MYINIYIYMYINGCVLYTHYTCINIEVHILIHMHMCINIHIYMFYDTYIPLYPFMHICML